MSPWLSLAVPLCLFVILSLLRSLAPGLFCVAINSGGKEFVCGSDYSHIGIRLLQLFGLSLWVLLLLTGSAEVFQRRATRPAVIAWSVSALLMVGLIIIWLTLPVDDPP